MDVVFDSPPTSVVYIRTLVRDHEIMSTLKIPKFEFYNSLNYTIGDKTYFILENRLLEADSNWYRIKGHCGNMPGWSLATKDEYGVLWEYLKANTLLDSLNKRKFITSDGPRSFVVWSLTFDDDEMESAWWNWAPSSVKKLNTDRGLVCVEKLTKQNS